MQGVGRFALAGDNGLVETSSGTKNEISARRDEVLAGGLRASEKVAIAFFTFAALVSLVFPISLRERATVVGLNLFACALVFLLSKFAEAQRSAFLATVRNWLPCLLIVLAYRESGIFTRPDPTHRLNYLFVGWDDVVLGNPWVLGALSFGSPWLQRYLEVAYFFCYPVVPLGLGSLYLARRRALLAGLVADQAISQFWTAVLLAVFSCYALSPLFPLTPPRVLFHDLPGPQVASVIRKLNFWLLGQYGTQVCTFPSGHVAAVTATAFAIRAYLPRAGALFILASVSIAAATVYGRYHYAADAAAGAVVGLAAFLISGRIHKS